MEGYGEWLQPSVFQCSLETRQRVETAAAPDAVIHHGEDHVPILDLGPADKLALQVESLGRRFKSAAWEPVKV